MAAVERRMLLNQCLEFVLVQDYMHAVMNVHTNRASFHVNLYLAGKNKDILNTELILLNACHAFPLDFFSPYVPDTS